MASDISRRSLVELVGRIAGPATVYSALNMMGLLATPTAYAAPPQLAPGSGNGKRVVIPGRRHCRHGRRPTASAKRATSAESSKRGTRGRRTGVDRARGGDRIVETDSTQQVNWETHRDLYFNTGPARLSSHHQGILGYCRELGVALELFVNDNPRRLDPARLPVRRQTPDGQGDSMPICAAPLPPLAARSVPEDADLRAVLRIFGDLDASLNYGRLLARRVTSMTTHRAPANEKGQHLPPLALDEIVTGPRSRAIVPRALFRRAVESIAHHVAAGGRHGRHRPRFSRKRSAA